MNACITAHFNRVYVSVVVADVFHVKQREYGCAGYTDCFTEPLFHVKRLHVAVRNPRYALLRRCFT